jgi:hypothetical protein
MSHYSSQSDEPEHGVWKSNVRHNMTQESLHNVRLNFGGVSKWRGLSMTQESLHNVRLNVGGVSKWKGLSFIQVWEKDPNYCLNITKMKSPVKLSMDRESKNLALFKIFMLPILESVKLDNIYIAGHDDFAGNMIGSSTEKPTKSYPSHKQQWIGDTKCRWPCVCCVERCTNKPTDGAHIFRSGSGSCYIAPMCQRCNFERANDLVAFKDMAEYTFPFKLRQGTWCLKVEDIHICSKYAISGNTVLTWGTYRGATFFEVFENDSSYCGWVLTTTLQNNNNAAMFKAWLRVHIS